MTDQTADAQPTTSDEARALGYRWTDWEVVYAVWKGNSLVQQRKTFNSEAAKDRWLDKAEAKANWHGIERSAFPAP